MTLPSFDQDRAAVKKLLIERGTDGARRPELEEVGGTEATRRARELREEGCQVRCHPDPDGVYRYFMRTDGEVWPEQLGLLEN